MAKHSRNLESTPISALKYNPFFSYFHHVCQRPSESKNVYLKLTIFQLICKAQQGKFFGTQDLMFLSNIPVILAQVGLQNTFLSTIWVAAFQKDITREHKLTTCYKEQLELVIYLEATSILWITKNRTNRNHNSLLKKNPHAE